MFLRQPLSLTSFDRPPERGAFWHSANAAYSAVPLRGAIVSMGLRGVQGGPKGRNRNLPWPPLQKGYIVTHSYLFTSTPQAIAKPSPGWNKVALLTAVRNSPCSCPFSVSLHPPLAALNSEPRPGSLLVRFISSHIKPALKGEVDMSVSEWTEGLKKERRFSLYRQPLSHDLRRASSPAGEPFGALYKLPHKTNKGTHCVPSFLQSLMLIRRQRISLRA